MKKVLLFLYLVSGAASAQVSKAYVDSVAASLVGQITTLKANQYLLPPPTVNTGAITANSFTLSLATLSNATPALTYLVEYAKDNTFGYAQSLSTTSLTPIVSGLSASTTYYVRVKGLNQNGYGITYSLPSTVTTSPATSLPALAAPVLMAGSPTQSTIPFSIGGVANAVTYTVQYATNGSFTSPSSYTTTSLTPSLSSLPASTTYYVRAYANASGYTTSAASNVLTATTLTPAATNLLLKSNLFYTNNVPWKANNAGVRGLTDVSVLAPDGISPSTASGLSFYGNSAQLNQEGIAFTNGNQYVFGIRVHAGTADSIRIKFAADFGLPSAVEATFNVATGTVQNVVGTSTISSLGSGWYLLTMPFMASAASLNLYIMPNEAAAASKDIYLWRSQLNPGSSLTGYLDTP